MFFLTGTDEHGLKMKQTAAKEGLTPRALADRNSALFRAMAEALGLSNDDFIRTTEPRHYRASEEIWRRMASAHNGDIFSTDVRRLVLGARRGLSMPRARRRSAPDGVRAGTAGIAGRMDRGGDAISSASRPTRTSCSSTMTKHPDFILPPERRNEVVSFVKGGLEDLSISRTTLDWGIPVPGAPTHVMYVWVDALTNYITAAGFPDEKAPRWHYWPADVHVIGKDIVRFHAVYWPAFLMSAGHRRCRERVFAHGFLYNRGEKMSKSVGNVVDPFDLVESLRRRSGALLLPARGGVRPGRQLHARKRSSTASTRTWPTTSAIWPSARCR